MQPFPQYGNCAAKDKLDDLFRLLRPDIFNTQYINARAAAQLVAVGLKAYIDSIESPEWNTNPNLRRVNESGLRLNLVCAALFDLVCNAEYLNGRVSNDRWIYCHRNRDESPSQPTAYYSFLKQCPQCCQDLGLDSRLSGAQHKPSSHHIGEITTTAMALFLVLLGKSAAQPLDVGVIAKQSHDVDAVAWRDDLLLLFETKASPLVTYPVRIHLARPYTQDSDKGTEELAQHKLVNVDYALYDLSLYLANANYDIPLGRPTSEGWPYTPLSTFVSTPTGLLTYLSAWAEVFWAYSIPKTERRGREISLGYIANGWGDEIDSNKTKGGLGRTDDIKKGTYQLLKYGAYYRARSPDLEIRGALVANLDPLFMFADYMEKLIDARWAPSHSFEQDKESPDYLRILHDRLFYIYDAVITFNRPVLNDPILGESLSFAAFEQALSSGALNDVLDAWEAKQRA